MKRVITLATYVTMVRICFIPCIVVSMMAQAWVAATVFFVLASLTDVIDGILARSVSEVSWLGTILDPLADKILVISVYAGLVYGEFIPVRLPGWFLGFVILHEIILIAGTVYWSFFKDKIAITVSRLAKLVGVAQFLFIFWALLCGIIGIAPVVLFYVVVGLIALARMCVLIQYGFWAYERI